MIDEVLPNLYRIEIPLPKNPLRALNSYLIKDAGRFLLIDTGMNREECRQAMSSALEDLKVDLRKTDFFITHLHADHLGQASRYATDTSVVYFNQPDADVMNNRVDRWREIHEIFISHGFPADELEKSLASHPGRRYSSIRQADFHIMREGDTIEIGDYSFRCIETPGHSPGHMCLYDLNKKILVSGDHIIFDITPNIAFWPEMANPLQQYLASLDKVYSLEVNIVLPGHRSIMSDHRKRIRELRAHHQARLKEVLSSLADGEKNTYQIVPYITWDIDCSSWELFPPQQKWFAFGETLSHLQYLEANQQVKRGTENQQVVFSLA